MKNRLQIGLLLAASLLAYANTLRNLFTMDDGLYIYGNPQVIHPSLLALFAPHHYANVFRPVTFGTFALNWVSAGERPFTYHLGNLLLHAAVTCLLYLLLQGVFEDSPQAKSVSLGAALLFAVHPIHTEAVASIVGRSELLAAGFLLAAWLLHVRDREIPALLCFLLALLSKESAVVFMPLVLVGDLARGKWKPQLRYARIAGITLLYLGLVWKLEGGRFGTASISMLDNPLARIPAGWRILNALRVGWKYVGLQVYPATLSCDYSFNEISPYMDWRHTLPATLAAVAVVAAWAWAVRQRRAGLVLAGGTYLFGFAATANILAPTGTIMGERLAYLPSAGFCLLAALGWSWLRERQRTLAMYVLVAVVSVLGVRTVLRNREWKDNRTLYSAAVRAAPGSAKMHSALGGLYLDAGEYDLARTELRAALRIYPEFPNALESYGLLESRQGNYQAAGWFLENALARSDRNNPSYDFMAVNVAALYMKTGHMDAALELLNREIAESPGYSRAWSNRAVIGYQRGDRESARADAEMALRLDPGNTQAQNVLRSLNGSVSSAAPRQ